MAAHNLFNFHSPKRLGSALLVIALCSPSLSLADQQSKAREDLAAIKQAISSQQKTLNSTLSQKNKALAALRDAEIALANTAKDVNKVRSLIRTNEHEIDQLNDQQGAIEKHIDKQKQKLGDEVLAAYSTGREAYLKLLLNQEKPEKISRLMRYYDYFYAARLEKVEDFKKSIDELALLRKQTDTATQALSQEQARLKEKQAALAKARSLRDAVFAKLNNKALNEEQELGQLKQDRKAIEQLINSLGEAITQLKTAGDTPFKNSKGRLSWPLKGKVISSFRSAYAGGRIRSNGILIAAKADQAVKSVAHGRIVYADWLRGFGMLTIVDHGGGYLSLYGQNNALLREPGDWVEAGDAIALAGNSGGKSKKPALYFEIRDSGKPQNPKRWLAKN